MHLDKSHPARWQIAAMAMQGMLASIGGEYGGYPNAERLSFVAVECADALIEELNLSFERSIKHDLK